MVSTARGAWGLGCVSLAVGLAGLACGSGSSSPPGPTAIDVAPATVTVDVGGAPVTFTASLTGGSASVAWSLSGPGSLSASTRPRPTEGRARGPGGPSLAAETSCEE